MSSPRQQAIHERMGPSTTDDVKLPSERSFAHVFAVVFVLIGLFPLWREGDVRWWSLTLAAAFLLLGYLAPKVLRPLNTLWFKFGLLLHAVVNPIILGAMFFLAVTPMALVMRVFGKRFLATTFEPSATTYWVKRTPPGPTAQSVRQQF